MISFSGLSTRSMPYPILHFLRMHFLTITILLEAIQELILSGSVVQVSSPPHVVNPLSVSIQSCGKKRLILDLRHVNKHIWKEKFKFEDIRNACIYLPFDHFMFKFDLKSGYNHQIDILQEHQTFLGFSCVANGVRKFFCVCSSPFWLILYFLIFY